VADVDSGGQPSSRARTTIENVTFSDAPEPETVSARPTRMVRRPEVRPILNWFDNNDDDDDDVEVTLVMS